MSRIFETMDSDVERLNALDLTKLLKKLLSLEAEANSIRRSAITASLEITVSDGGEDASIEWQGAPDRTEWIPHRSTLFQCKATETGPRACAAEVVTANGSAVKPRVDQVLSAGGSYVLFCTKPCNRKMEIARIKAIRDALQAKGKAYAGTAEILVYGANRISDWANNYVSAIIAIRKASGAHLPTSIKTWSEWCGYPEYERLFVSDSDLDAKIAALRNLFANNTKQVARIIGLSGVGKTRLALEALRPPEDPKAEPERQALSEGCVYIDAEQATGLQGYVAEWVREHYRGILVVDNCHIALHKSLQREVGHTESRLHLLTLDYSMDDHLRHHPYIELTKVSDDVIKGIVQTAYPGLPDTDVSRVVSFAQGFPRMAVLIADAHLEREPDIANLKDQDLVDRLLWQRSPPNPEARKVIEACSLFKHLGYDENVAEQRVFTAERICRIDRHDFFRHAENFIRHRIIARRNRYIRVVPFPLAITLAAQWWQGCSRELARELFLSEMPNGMAEALCDQLAKLDFVPRAKEIVADLCGGNGPFGQAEVLLSEQGSRLFRSIVEIDSEPCLQALTNAIGDMTRAQLLEIGPARRNFVWALEKLCFWENTFSGAARIMLALAAAENESWGNNATNQFLQLFHLHLSGTQAAPDARMEIVDEALESECPERRVLAVRAMESALEMDHFTRQGGVEEQGSRSPAEDWEPKVWSDIFNYQDACIQRLTRIVCSSDRQLATIAAQGLGGSIRGLIQRSRQESLDRAVRTIASARNGYWPEALHNLRLSLEYEGPQMPAEIRAQVETWIELLQPRGLEERLRLLISLPEYEYRKEDGTEHYTDFAAERAVALAKELAPQVGQLMPYLPILMHGEQRQAFIFGRTLAQSVDNQDTFTNRALAALRDIDQGNPTLLCGFLAGQTRRDLITQVLETAAADDALLPYLVDLTRFSRPTPDDLMRVTAAARKGLIPIMQLRSFRVGSVLDHLSPLQVMAFCDEIAAIGITGVACAFGILFMYCHGDNERHLECRPAFRRFLDTSGFVSEVGQNPTFLGHGWEQITLSFLAPPNYDAKLSESISRDIVEACAQKEFSHGARYYVGKVIAVLLQHYFKFAWPSIGEALLGKDWRIHHHLNYFLAGEWNKTKTGTVLAVAPLDELLAWARSTKPEGPRSITRCLPVVEQNEEDKTVMWHPFARAFIDAFGDDVDFLRGIVSNLHTFTWSGSVIPYYEMQIRLMHELRSHDTRTVRKWAQDNINWLEEQITLERKKEDERDLGIY